MTAVEMKDAFLLAYDINSNAAVGFNDDEIYELLTISQNKVIEELFVKYGPDSISNLIKLEVVNIVFDITIRKGTGNTVSFKEDGLYYIDSWMQVARSNFPSFTDAPVDVDRIPIAMAGKFKYSAYNETVFLNPKLVISENDSKVEIFFDAYTSTTNNLNMRYIKKPLDIIETVDSEVDLRWHEKIVQEAVTLAAITTNDSRTQEEKTLNVNRL